MRSIAVFIGVFAVIPFAIVYPYAGVLLWSWIAFMSPHREAFGVAYDFPFNFWVAFITLFAWLFSQEPKRLPSNALSGLLLLFAILISITTLVAIDVNYSVERWDRHIRTLILVFVVMMLAFSKLRIQALLWIIAISLGYYAAKGGGYILTGGSGRLYGPEASQIADNNDLALAIVMTIPILSHLRVTSANPFIKLACLVVMFLAVAAVVGTGSRGGFIGLAVVLLGYLTFNRPKLGSLLIPVAMAVGVWTYAPAAWFQRVSTIQEFEQDQSVNQRFTAWNTSWNLALDRPLVGGGFSAIETYAVDRRYNRLDYSQSSEVQEAARTRAAHSVFFQVLGDHGFIGLGLWLAIVGIAISNLLRVNALVRSLPGFEWEKSCARSLLVAFMGYLAAGTFLSMAYYDLFLCLVGLTAPLLAMVRKNVLAQNRIAEELEPETALPGWRQVALKK